MYRACSRCGKVHSTKYKCNHNKIKRDYTEEKKLRNQYKWELKSKEIREKAKYLCEVCKDKGIYNYNMLEVHHITPIRENKTKYLDNYNLVCLCQQHHKEAEKNKIDKDYLLTLAYTREHQQ